MRTLVFLHKAVKQLSGRALTTQANQPGFGLLLDVDGVLLRGGRAMPEGRRVFRRLVDASGTPRLPFLFLTNAGTCLSLSKAQNLSHLLGVPISPEQVVLSHGPLRLFNHLQEKNVLVTGQGPVESIAKDLGFQKVVTIEQLREQHPLLDMVEHRTVMPQASLVHTAPRVEAVILFGEPIRWESNLQLVIDVLLTNGNLSSAYKPNPSVQLPVIACNTDLLWLADAPSPRFGHGVFLLCLESVYRRMTGEALRYEAVLGKPSLLSYRYAEQLLSRQAAGRGWSNVSTLYAIGDNPTTDVYGANLYNCYLGQQRVATATHAKIVAQGTGLRLNLPPETTPPSAVTHCHSILVCTGVYNPNSELLSNSGQQMDPQRAPSHVVRDVEAALDLVLELEGFDL